MIKKSLFSPNEVPLAALEPLLLDCLAELEAPFGADPYWPKWDNHWWRLALLLEIGAIGRVPAELLERFAAWLDGHYLHHFPLLESELPPGCDPYRQILCFCALGTAARILNAGGIDPFARLPWLQDWLSRYRLPDGGFNCDEQAYTGSRKSSLVSTAPMLEALLESRPDGHFSPAEHEILAAGLDYLIDHQLIRSRSGKLLEPLWQRPLFPRFYEYDLLRGLDLASALAQALQRPLPQTAIQDVVTALEADHAPQPWYLAELTTLRQTGETWQKRQPAGSFALLDRVSQPEIAAAFVTAQWQRVQARLAALDAAGLLTQVP